MQNTIFSRRRVVTFVCAASVLAACGTTFAAGTVNLNGSTTVLPVMQQVSEAFMQKNPGVVVTISGTGSGNGIKALRDKMTDVAMSSRDLKDKEKKDFEAHGINPVKIPVALDAIIPVVSPKNAVASLTMEQLRDLFAGKIKNWKELGGADAPWSWSAATPPPARSNPGRNSSWARPVCPSALSSRAPPAASFRPLPAIRTPLATSVWATSTARSRASS